MSNNKKYQLVQEDDYQVTFELDNSKKEKDILIIYKKLHNIIVDNMIEGKEFYVKYNGKLIKYQTLPDTKYNDMFIKQIISQYLERNNDNN